MPEEYRLIQFKDTEIKEALERWLRSNGHFSQYGRVDRLDMSESDKRVTVSVRFSESIPRQRRNSGTLSIDHDDVCQALILYCKNSQIPLARNGRKVIRLLDKNLALYYQLK